MKPKTEDEKKTEFETITKLAEHHPVINSKIQDAPADMKKLIMAGLSYIIQAEENDRYDRLLFLCRLAKGSGYDVSAEDLYKTGLEFDMDDLYRFSKELAEYKYTFLVEAFILANISGETSPEIISLTADLVAIMECDSEDIRVTGITAKSILTGNPDAILEMPVPSDNRWSGKLREFITDEWIIKHRVCCEDWLSDYDIKEIIPSGSIVRKGDVLCSKGRRNIWYSPFPSKSSTEAPTNIEAPCDGVFYFIEISSDGSSYKSLYVVSYFDDYTELRDWYCHENFGSE
jgi:hypothetical protein